MRRDDQRVHRYKDINTGKLRFTRGEFVGWSEPTGLLDAVYAGFERASGEVLWVMRGVLTPETRGWCDAETIRRRIQARKELAK